MNVKVPQVLVEAIDEFCFEDDQLEAHDYMRCANQRASLIEAVDNIIAAAAAGAVAAIGRNEFVFMSGERVFIPDQHVVDVLKSFIGVQR